jgi:hypothetical protein
MRRVQNLGFLIADLLSSKLKVKILKLKSQKSKVEGLEPEKVKSQKLKFASLGVPLR